MRFPQPCPGRGGSRRKPSPLQEARAGFALGTGPVAHGMRPLRSPERLQKAPDRLRKAPESALFGHRIGFGTAPGRLPISSGQARGRLVVDSGEASDRLRGGSGGVPGSWAGVVAGKGPFRLQGPVPGSGQNPVPSGPTPHAHPTTNLVPESSVHYKSCGVES